LDTTRHQRAQRQSGAVKTIHWADAQPTRHALMSRLPRLRLRHTRRVTTILLVTFMQYDFGYFDDATCRLEPIDQRRL
jgi:hypothetical protein